MLGSRRGSRSAGAQALADGYFLFREREEGTVYIVDIGYGLWSNTYIVFIQVNGLCIPTLVLFRYFNLSVLHLRS